MTFTWPKKLRTFWFTTYFLALPVTLLFIFLLPASFSKYRSEITKSGIIDKKDGFEYYADLDGDGNSQRIVLFNNTEGKASIKILRPTGFVLDQFYFSGEIIQDQASLVTGAFDSTGQIGIFLVTRSNDSILLHGVCPNRKEKSLFHDKFITTIAKQNGNNDFIMSGMLLYDLDHDGTKEIISGFMAGFQVQPRFLFTYNFHTGRLLKSSPMASLQWPCEIADLNGDGIPEILSESYAVANNLRRFELPYDDSCAWLMVFDHHLDFVFPPVKFPGKYIQLLPRVLTVPGKNRIIVLLTTRSPGTGPPKLLLFNVAGKLLKERILDDTLQLRKFDLVRSDEQPNNLFLIREGGMVEELDSGLQVIDREKIEGVGCPNAFAIDIDGDGIREFFFPGYRGTPFVITRADFSHPVTIANPLDFDMSNHSVILEKGRPGSLFIQSGNRYIICSYERNPVFYLKYPVYLTIYLLALGFILLIRYLQRRTLRQRYDAEKKIAEMQLLLLGNHLDPHFTFNAINSISASILREKPEVANKNLLSLSRLMRSSVLQSDKLSRSLAEELDFLQNYINLVHSRKNGSFQYRIDIGKEIDLGWQVPKMIAQIFIENAIKHGLKPLNGGGLLIVRVNRKGEEIILEIEDNGVGRKDSRENGDKGTGKGMSMIDQTIRIINKFNQKKIRLTITDLEDEQGHSRGTKVSIVIPVGMNYRFYEK